jgi:CRISPR-associated protein Cas1
MSSVDDFIGAERLLAISNRCHISFSTNNFRVDLKDEPRKVTVPAGDVLAVILESERSTISIAALAACGASGIPVIICRTHLPVALTLPLDAGWNGAEMRRLQAYALRGEAAAKRLWRRTVQAKIRAQATAIAEFGGDNTARLKRLADTVGLDGQETVEAQAAAIYWRVLLDSFRRSDGDDPRNALLNWGYAVLLASIGRAVVAFGFDPALGFGHAGQSNSWALACDLMEPYRPTVDRVVADAERNGGIENTAGIKSALAAVFANDAAAKTAIMETVRGYREFLKDGNETRVPYPDRALVA